MLHCNNICRLCWASEAIYFSRNIGMIRKPDSPFRSMLYQATRRMAAKKKPSVPVRAGVSEMPYA